MRRVKRRADRPLLQTVDPAATVTRLLSEREPVYEHADITIASREVPHDKIVDECLDALRAQLAGAARTVRRSVSAAQMTAPLKHSDTTIVDVALGERAYDIVIGRDVLASLGARIAALRPGVRTAIVTDKTVAQTLAGGDRSLACGRGHRDLAHHRR